MHLSALIYLEDSIMSSKSGIHSRYAIWMWLLVSLNLCHLANCMHSRTHLFQQISRVKTSLHYLGHNAGKGNCTRAFVFC